MAQLATTLPLVGLIWLVQVVSYPLFLRVGRPEFAAYHEAHSRLITYVVGPLMLAELAASFAWAASPDPTLPRSIAWAGFALAVATWALTFFVAVPRHEVLAHGYDAPTISSLVTTNWLRTAAWTLRGALLLWVAARDA
ncbi:MAG: hypothetical protein JST00_31120 [Deltaproteobacteria bacterium]|nr:hypothetical protein [Deltaproteobacteria bacterium]